MLLLESTEYRAAGPTLRPGGRRAAGPGLACAEPSKSDPGAAPEASARIRCAGVAARSPASRGADVSPSGAGDRLVDTIKGAVTCDLC